MIDLGLVTARFIHYAASTALAGIAFFPIYACAGGEPPELARWRNKLMVWSAILALISGLGWFAFAAANMSGGLADVADLEVIASVIRDTGFGGVWAARMVVATVLVATLLRRSSRAGADRDKVTFLLAAGLLASLAGAGHSQMAEGWASALHVTADAAHLLAAGAWLGGLAPLGFILRRGAATPARPTCVDIDSVLIRFSGMGYVAVATLIGTGLVNSWFLVGSISSLLHSTYGQILIAKLALFASMLALAAANKFWLMPALEASRRRDLDGSDLWRRRLRTHVLGEQSLGLLVLLSVSVLGTIRPAIGQ
ncbi:copper homeostasis membrane protein CopD [Rhodopseudomonas pseudopalustris]|uniref:Putative copper resistance protein D n=1 Tax=Rhodopseudomonas pseudopalustris TaxID=1513892 RepID=A0A1H8LQR9_9BRAD|nr:copper homeostasis membrane protein CopD [Rhodopseudomonas pseudopalustris]SEO07512.1 putative copper resistance protein D [Rhodopseudomonas pseudopalustris]